MSKKKLNEVEEELKGVGINVAFDLFSKSMKTHLWEFKVTNQINFDLNFNYIFVSNYYLIINIILYFL